MANRRANAIANRRAYNYGCAKHFVLPKSVDNKTSNLKKSIRKLSSLLPLSYVILYSLSKRVFEKERPWLYLPIGIQIQSYKTS